MEKIENTYNIEKGLSEKALENLRRNTEIRLSKKPKVKKYLYLEDGQEAIRKFDAEQIEPQEIDYDGNGEKVQRFEYTVTDQNTGEIEVFRTSMTTSGDIDAVLTEGHRVLRIRREGSGYNTKYYIAPVKES